MFANWYQFRMGAEAEEVSIMTTPIYGDPDFVVKVGGKATIEDYDYKSLQHGAVTDQVIIPETKICTDCFISVMVYGRATSRFSILVTLTDTVIVLTNGIAQQESVDAKNVQYYVASAPTNSTATATLTVFTGASNLYLSLKFTDPHQAGPDVMVSTTQSAVVQQLTTAAMIKDTKVYVGVGGAGLNSTYTIRVNFVPNTKSGLALQPSAYTLLRLTLGLPQVICSH
jgi:hypothetical protein